MGATRGSVHPGPTLEMFVTAYISQNKFQIYVAKAG